MISGGVILGGEIYLVILCYENWVLVWWGIWFVYKDYCLWDVKDIVFIFSSFSFLKRCSYVIDYRCSCNIVIFNDVILCDFVYIVGKVL